MFSVHVTVGQGYAPLPGGGAHRAIAKLRPPCDSAKVAMSHFAQIAGEVAKLVNFAVQSASSAYRYINSCKSTGSSSRTQVLNDD